MQQSTLLRSILVGTALIAFSLMPKTALADSIRTELDGRELVFDAPPIVENDRMLVPVRGILEPLGALLKWDAPSRSVTATLGTTVVKATVGTDTAEVNGQPVKLEVPVRIMADRTMVPLRFFAEHLGMKVDWDNTTRTIIIQSSRSGALSRDSSTVSRRAATVVETARKSIGVKYSWGGTSLSTGFDCSGFVYYLFNKIGIELPRTSYEQLESGIAVKQANLLPGDLVFFETYGSGASHVGVYVGNSNFIHSQSAETGVKETSIWNPWWSQRYVGARRVIR